MLFNPKRCIYRFFVNILGDLKESLEISQIRTLIVTSWFTRPIAILTGVFYNVLFGKGFTRPLAILTGVFYNVLFGKGVKRPFAILIGLFYNVLFGKGSMCT
jgi:hypothetical protein